MLIDTFLACQVPVIIFIRSHFLPFAPLLFIVLFFSKRQKGAPKVALLAQEKNTSLKNKEFHCGQG